MTTTDGSWQQQQALAEQQNNQANSRASAQQQVQVIVRQPDNKEAISNLQRQVDLMWTYLHLKVAQKDLHGIWDSAIEIEKLEGMIRVLKEKI